MKTLEKDEETSASNCSSHTQPPHLAKSRTRSPHYSDDQSRLHTITIGASDSDSDNDSTTSRSSCYTSRKNSNHTTMSSTCSDHTSSGNGKEKQKKHRHLKEHSVYSVNSDSYIPIKTHGRRSSHHSRNSLIQGTHVHSDHVDHETSSSSNKRKVKKIIKLRRRIKKEEEQHEKEKELSEQDWKTNVNYDDDDDDDNGKPHSPKKPEQRSKKQEKELHKHEEEEQQESLYLPKNKTNWSYGNEWMTERKTAQKIAPLLHVMVQQSSSDNDRTNGKKYNSSKNYLHNSELENNEFEHVPPPHHTSSILSNTSAVSTPFKDFATSNVSTPPTKWKGRLYKQPHHQNHLHQEHELRKYKYPQIATNENIENRNNVQDYSVINSPKVNEEPATLITIPGIRTSKSSTPERMHTHTGANKNSSMHYSDESLNLFDNVQASNLPTMQLQRYQNTNNFPVCISTKAENDYSNEADDLSSAVRVVEVQLQERLQQLRVLQKMYNKLNSHNTSLALEFNALRANYTKMQSQLRFQVSNEVRHVKADLSSLKKFTQLVLDDFSESMCSTTNEITEILLLLMSTRSEQEEQHQQQQEQSMIQSESVNYRPQLMSSESSISTKGLLASKTHMIVDHFHQQLQQSEKEQHQQQEGNITNNNNNLMHKSQSNYVNSALLVPETSYDWFNGISPQRLPSHGIHSSRRKANNEEKHEHQKRYDNSLLSTTTITETMTSSPKSLTASQNNVKNARNSKSRRKSNCANLTNLNSGKKKNDENDLVSSRSNDSSMDTNEESEKSEIMIEVLEDKLQCATQENWRLRSELEQNEREWQERMINVKDAHKAREMTLAHELELMRSALAKHYEQHNNNINDCNNDNEHKDYNKEEKLEGVTFNMHDRPSSSIERTSNKEMESTSNTKEDTEEEMEREPEEHNETQDRKEIDVDLCPTPQTNHVECIHHGTPTATNFRERNGITINNNNTCSTWENDPFHHHSISSNGVNTRSNVPEVERRVKALVARSLHHTHDASSSLLHDKAAKRNEQSFHFNGNNNSKNKDLNRSVEQQSYSTQMHEELIKRAQHYLQIASDQKKIKRNGNCGNQEDEHRKDNSGKSVNKIKDATIEPTYLHHQVNGCSTQRNTKNALHRTQQYLFTHKSPWSADKRKRSPKTKSKMAILADGLWAEKLLAQRRREAK